MDDASEELDDRIERSPDDEFLTTEEAAKYMRLSRRTLEKWRVYGGGPPYTKHGRYVVYRRRKIDIWSDANIHQTTAEYRKDRDDDGTEPPVTPPPPGPDKPRVPR